MAHVGRPEGPAHAPAVDVRTLLREAIGGWVDGQGFGFQAGGVPGLQGTEMWLAIIWLLADPAGVSGALGYRPCGVHRPEPKIA